MHGTMSLKLINDKVHCAGNNDSKLAHDTDSIVLIF